jgi:hypothetical protein
MAKVYTLAFVLNIPGAAGDSVCLMQRFLRPHVQYSHPHFQHHAAHHGDRPEHEYARRAHASVSTPAIGESSATSMAQAKPFAPNAGHVALATTNQSANQSTQVGSGRNASQGLWVAVMSSSSNLQKRHTIRNTWKKFERELNGAVEVRFILCSDGYSRGMRNQLISEFKTFGDTVTLDCPEGYYHGLLTKKVYATMMYFLNQVDQRFDTFMKADDDAFLFLPEIYDAVRQNTAENFYMGQMLDPEEPFRSPDHKWYEPVENWPDIWPRAASGSGYILDRPLLERMLTKDWENTQKLFLYNEDKAVATWVKFEVEQRDQRVEFVDLPGKDGVPSTSKPLLIYHHIGVSVMNCLWREVAVRKLSVDKCRS